MDEWQRDLEISFESIFCESRKLLKSGLLINLLIRTLVGITESRLEENGKYY